MRRGKLFNYGKMYGIRNAIQSGCVLSNIGKEKGTKDTDCEKTQSTRSLASENIEKCNMFPSVPGKESKGDAPAETGHCEYRYSPITDFNYCYDGLSLKWDVKTSGALCEGKCTYCVDVSNLIGEKPEQNKVVQKCQEVDWAKMPRIEVVDSVEYLEKYGSILPNKFEVLEADEHTVKMITLQALNRKILDNRMQIYMDMLDQSLEYGGEKVDEVEKAIQQIQELLEQAAEKAKDYESPAALERWTNARKRMKERYDKTNEKPCLHDWCPDVCANVVNSDGVDVDESLLDKKWEGRMKRFSGVATDIKETDKDGEWAPIEGEDSAMTNPKLGQVLMAAASVAGRAATESLKKVHDTIEKLKKFVNDPANKGAWFSKDAKLRKMVQQFVNDLEKDNAGKPKNVDSYTTMWTYSMCERAECYAGSGDENRPPKRKITEIFQLKGNEAVSASMSEYILDGRLTSVGFKQLTKICEIRLNRGTPWYERDDYKEKDSSFLELGQHVVDTALYKKVESMEELPAGSKVLETHCKLNLKDPNSIKRCMGLKKAFVCHRNRAIVDLVPKKECKKENEEFCLMSQSMMMPCLYHDCLNPREKSTLSVTCMEDNAHLENKGWACGYQADGGEDCNCKKMRAVNGGLFKKAILGLKSIWKANKIKIIGGIGMGMVAGFCLANPACGAAVFGMSTAGGAVTAQIDSAAKTVEDLAGSSGCSPKAIMEANPGIGSPGGGWAQAANPTGKSSKATVAFVTKGWAKLPPFLVPKGIQEGAQVFKNGHGLGTSASAGDAFRTDYLPSDAKTFTLPKNCMLGQLKNSKAFKVGTKVLGGLAMAKTAAKLIKKAHRALSLWGIKSYDKDIDKNELYGSTYPIQLQEKGTTECLALKEEKKGGIVEMRKCTGKSDVWMPVSRKKEGNEDESMLYHAKKNVFHTASGDKITRWMVDDRDEKNMCMYNKKLNAGIAWGSCVITEASKLTEGLSGAMFGSPGDIHNFGEWELKSNGMLCRDGCRYCVVRKDGELVMGMCGVKKPKKHMFAKATFDVNPNLVHFEALSVEAEPLSPGALTPDPKTKDIKRCGESEKGEYINDIFPVSSRRVVCSGIQSCVFDDDVAECVPGDPSAPGSPAETGSSHNSDGRPAAPLATGSSGPTGNDDTDEENDDGPVTTDDPSATTDEPALATGSSGPTGNDDPDEENDDGPVTTDDPSATKNKPALATGGSGPTGNDDPDEENDDGPVTTDDSNGDLDEENDDGPVTTDDPSATTNEPVPELDTESDTEKEDEDQTNFHRRRRRAES
jgi:hypothetical protein